MVQCLSSLGHDVHALGVGGELNPIRKAVEEFKPRHRLQPARGFRRRGARGTRTSSRYLELLKMKYTGCNARGLLLGRDKALAKKLLSYHRIRVAEFAIAARGRIFRRPKRLAFPLFVKSLTFDASIGISQASVVESEEKLAGARTLHPREHRHRRPGGALHRGARALRRNPRQPASPGAADLGAELRQDAGGRPQDRHRAAQVEPHLSEEARHRERPGARAAGGPGRRASSGSASASTRSSA